MALEFEELDIRALIEALVLAEKIKPTQVAKREVFRKYGLLGTRKDRIFTAVVYGLGRTLGLVDKVIQMATSVSVESLDPWTRSLLRLYTYLTKFSQVNDRSLPRALKIYGPIVVSEKMGREAGWRARELLRKIDSFVYKPSTPEDELELRYMVSSWLIRRVIEMLGEEEAKQFLEAINRIPALGLRVNTLRASIEEVAEELARFGVEMWRSPYVPTVIKYRGFINYEELRCLKEGKAFPQDDSSALASILLDPKPGEVVVDMCAAPGGKTTHIAELMRDRGLVIAFELYADRAEYLKNTVRRGGFTCVEVVQGDARTLKDIVGIERVDRVLLDPPCSSTGAVAKHAEARWRLTPERLQQLVDLQKKLLEVAVEIVKPGGIVVYTTCSILPEENEYVVQYILEKYRGYIELEALNGPFDPGFLPGTMRAWPHRHDTTGFFYAKIRKIRSLSDVLS